MMFAIKQEVSPEIKKTLDEVLIAYLWNLVVHYGPDLYCELKPGELGGREVQEIYLYTPYCMERRRVFGVEAKTVEITVRRQNGALVLLPTSEARSRGVPA